MPGWYNHLTNEKGKAMSRTIKVGSVGVDSGQVMIVDPCYVLKDEFAYGSSPTGGMYDETCRLTVGHPTHHGETTFGAFATSTYYGDGEYPVYADVDENGRILRMTIEFVPSYEYYADEDECDECGYSDCDGECKEKDEEDE